LRYQWAAAKRARPLQPEDNPSEQHSEAGSNQPEPGLPNGGIPPDRCTSHVTP
jgi:hypothetical protein